MKQMAGRETNQDRAREQDAAPHGQASEHGHSGEGSASVLAHLISESEKQRRQNGQAGEARGGERG